jgi:hypothetical protein
MHGRDVVSGAERDRQPAGGGVVRPAKHVARLPSRAGSVGPIKGQSPLDSGDLDDGAGVPA